MSELERLKARKAALDKKIAAAARKESQARRKKEDTAKFTLGGLVMKLCSDKPEYRDQLLNFFYDHLSDDLEQMAESRRIALREVWKWDVSTNEI